MHSIIAFDSRRPWLVLALLWLTSLQFMHAQSATGTVQGRVFNPANGAYVATARLTVDGTSIEAFTDSEGNYRLSNVPAGTVKIKAFYTGMAVQTEEITVSAGQTVQHNFSLSAASGEPQTNKEGEVVKLSEFVVGSSREMAATAIAINEQRFAPNITNVLATEEFGSVTEGNVAEFLKYMPGVTISYSGGSGRGISIEGVPNANVPVTINGLDLATANGATDRAAAMDMVSINNVSRIEVSYSPTPESQGSALAGSVNMVPRSSFERQRPIFNYSVYVLMRDDERDIKKTPGPRSKDTRKIHPGFDFSYVRPVNERFGFTLSAGYSKQYSPENLSLNTWRAGAGTANFPATTPENAYRTSYAVRDSAKETSRRSFGATVDFRLTRSDRISFSFQTGGYLAEFNNRRLTFNVGRVLPGNFSTIATQGAPGAGSLEMSNQGRNRSNRNYMLGATWRHDGPIWRAEAGAGHSYALNRFYDIGKGLFNTTIVRRTGVTVALDQGAYLRPGIITVTDGATGAPVDPFNLDNYAVVSADSNQQKFSELRRSAYGNMRREFSWAVPLTVKGGFDLRQTVREARDGPTMTFAHVGADGRTGTTPVGTDDGAGQFLDVGASLGEPPYGLPKIQWLDNALLWDYQEQHPNYFTRNANSEYRDRINRSKHAEEIISSLYFRGDMGFLERRLKLVGGVRAEQTNIKAEGPLTDPTLNFQRSPSGAFILDGSGRPLRISMDQLEVSRLTFIERGTRVEKEYLRLFPSINASFNVRENLIARAAYYHSVGRPNFNQYAGAVTLPDTEAIPSPTNRIGVNNAGIKAWSAKTLSVRLEYYFQGVGQVSLGAFRRDFENFFGSTVFSATPAFLANYDLNPDIYGAYDVSTQHNVQTTVRMQGLVFNYKQALTFLPRWARGIQVFANGTVQRLTGEGDFTGNNYMPRSGSWGVSLTREKYNVRLNWNYRGPRTDNQERSRLYLDVIGEYYIRKNFGLFANLRNVNNAADIVESTDLSRPYHTRLNSSQDFRSLWSFGVKGSF